MSQDDAINRGTMQASRGSSNSGSASNYGNSGATRATGDFDSGSTTQPAGELKRAAKEVAQKVKSTATDTVSQIGSKISDETSHLFDDQKNMVCEKVDGLVGSLRQSADSLSEKDPTVGRFMTTAADKVEGMSSYLREHDLRDVYQQVEGFARRHPAIVLGGLFVVGTLAARFLKASRERSDREMYSSSTGSFGDGYTPEDSYGASESGFQGSGSAVQGSGSGSPQSWQGSASSSASTKPSSTSTPYCEGNL